MKITAIVLTYNEEIHLHRCLTSIKDVADEIVVVDSFSNDSTLVIAESFGAEILTNDWLNYSTQFNWALNQLPGDTDWVLRIDADEFLTDELIQQVLQLKNNNAEIYGVYLNRRMAFLGKIIKYGGVFPIKVLRIFKYGYGYCENRWMDEHIKVKGQSLMLSGELVDDNRNTLSWWLDKHNKYASREAVDILNLEYSFMPHDTIASFDGLRSSEIKRWIKEAVYLRSPLGWRAFVYFIYRYIVRLGFLDGYRGFAFHFLQGFWYRYIVDAKVREVKNKMAESSLSVEASIEVVLGIKVN